MAEQGDLELARELVLELERKLAEPREPCGVCLGQGKPISGLPCICGGAGTQDAEVIGLRKMIHMLEVQLAEARREQRELLFPLLKAASHALKSYANGNSAPALALSISKTIDGAIEKEGEG